MLFIDAHVHIYDCYDLEAFFEAALQNRIRASNGLGAAGAGHDGSSSVLLLSESAGCHWFENTVAELYRKSSAIPIGKMWEIRASDDPLAVVARRLGGENVTLRLIAGRQIATRERLEVLSLFCRETLADGLSLEKTVEKIRDHGGVAVAPWGAGKWLGKRGKLLQEFLLRDRGKRLFLGGSGGRPSWWPTPRHLSLAEEMNIPVLSGSDPLPLTHEVARVGSYGFAIAADTAIPSTSLRELLLAGNVDIIPYGDLLANRDFWLNQLQLRYRKG